MIKNKKNPLLPYITIGQIIEYDRERPETYTESHLINAVCEAFQEVGTHSSEAVANYLDVNLKELSSAVKIITGHFLTDIRRKLNYERVRNIFLTNPNLSTDEIAKAAGFADRSALYRMLGRKQYDELIAKYVRS